jgi:hypothetical protein
MVAAAKTLAVKVGTSARPAGLPYWLAYLVSLPCLFRLQHFCFVEVNFYRTNMSSAIYFS